MNIKNSIIIAILLIIASVSIAPSTANIVEDISYFSNVKKESALLGSDTICYAVEYNPYPSGCRFIWFDPDDPGTFYHIRAWWPGTIFPQSATFVKDECWICESNGNIAKVDLITGEVEEVGNSGTGELVGLSYHARTDTLFGISTKALYKINIENGSATLVGNMGNPGLMISIDCDNDGYMYGYELDPISGDVYYIDIESGKATKLGESGVSLNYGQDMAYEDYTETMYACVFNQNTNRGEFHWINLETGKFTYIDTLYIGNHLTSLAIPYSFCNRIPNTPVIDGCKNGKVGVEYEYKFLLSDPDGDRMYLRVDWGNGTFGLWQGPYSSNSTVKINHNWSQKGTYTIRAQAKDIYGRKSDLGTLNVTITKSKLTKNIFKRDLFKYLTITFLFWQTINNNKNYNEFIIKGR